MNPASDNFNYQHLVRQDCPLRPGSRAVAYCRDSGGEAQGRSVAQQIEAIKEYCQHHRIVLEGVYFDEARLSSNTEKRDGLQAMLIDLHSRFRQIRDRYKRAVIKRERNYGVITWKSNRMGRDEEEATYIAFDLKLRGLTIVELITAATTGNPIMDSFIESFQRWQDAMLLDEISKNVKRGQIDRVTLRDDDAQFLSLNPGWQSTGGYLGVSPGVPPVGFKGERIAIDLIDRVNKRGGGELHVVQRIVPNHDEQIWERCRIAWEMRRQGLSITQIMRETKIYDNAQSYSTFFKNRIYTGDRMYGGKLLVDFVPALISRDWYEQEQLGRAERQQKHIGQPVAPSAEPRRVGSRFLLSSLIFCGAVDGHEHPMYGDTTTSRARKAQHDYYICTEMKNSRGERCSARRVSARKLHDAVVERLLAVVLTRETLQPIASQMAKQLADRNRDLDVTIRAILDRLNSARHAAEQIADSIERIGYSPTLHSRLQQREEEIRVLEGELAEQDKLRVPDDEARVASARQIDEWIDDLRELLIGDDVEMQQQVIHHLVEKVVVNGTDVDLHYRFPIGPQFRVRYVRLEGFEPPTIGSEDQCSIH